VEQEFVVKVMQEVNFQQTQVQVVEVVELVLLVKMEQLLLYPVVVDLLTVEQE
tara:strand:- start:275 stop:433 length:159 start_codon:yes stop_codon:yes gene_type:complete